MAEQTAAADNAQIGGGVEKCAGRSRSIAQCDAARILLGNPCSLRRHRHARNLHPGALVGPASGQAGAQPIVQIENLNRLRVVVPVPEAYVAGVREGQQVTFSVPAYPGRTFRAPIARISHDINQTTRTMQVELDFHNADAQITPGTFANVEWPIQRNYPTLFVPATAITTDLQRTFVIRVREGKTEWVDVKNGVTVNGKTEVFGDLKSGDLVVQNATDSIGPGIPVEAHEQ